MFKFELNRLLLNKKSSFVLLAFTLVTLYFVSCGITEYKSFLDSKEVFVEYEKAKIKRYVTWGQYSGFGFRLFYEHSPLFIFFNNSSVFQDIESNIDVLEIIKIYSPRKGKKIANKGEFKDLSWIIYILGSLYIGLMGIMNIKSDKFLKLYSTTKNLILSISIRLLLLDIIFAGILLLNFLLPKLHGISFSPHETKIFISYSIYILLFLNFFYFLGLLLYTSFKTRRFLKSLAIYFIIVFIIPVICSSGLLSKLEKLPANESLNLKKLDAVMKLEKEAQNKLFELLKANKEIKKTQKQFAQKIFDEVYKLNKEKEKEFNSLVSKIINSHEENIFIFPTTFYKFLSREISSKGYYGYFRFLKYHTTLRDKFVRFYLKKRYQSNDKNVESFVKDGENIFKAPVQMPESFLKATAITAGYTFILLLAAFIILYLRSKKIPEVDTSAINTKKGRTTFVLRKKIDERHKLFYSYKSQKNTVCIDRVTLDDIDVGITPAAMLTHFSKISGNDPKFARGTLHVLGIENIDKIKRKNLSDEIIKKIYAAAILIDEAEIIVVNDFLKGESKLFEQQFLTLMQLMEAKEKIILYLSSEPFETSLRQTYLSDEVNDTERIIDLTEVSLR